MKIAVSAQGNSLGSEVDPRFGRCKYFIIMDLDHEEVEVIENEAKNFASGAGIKSATLVVEAGVEAVLTGQLGPKATRVLQSGNVKMYCNVAGTIAQAVERFKQGEFSEVTKPTVQAHSGL